MTNFPQFLCVFTNGRDDNFTYIPYNDVDRQKQRESHYLGIYLGTIDEANDSFIMGDRDKGFVTYSGQRNPFMRSEDNKTYKVREGFVFNIVHTCGGL